MIMNIPVPDGSAGKDRTGRHRLPVLSVWRICPTATAAYITKSKSAEEMGVYRNNDVKSVWRSKGKAPGLLVFSGKCWKTGGVWQKRKILKIY